MLKNIWLSLTLIISSCLSANELLFNINPFILPRGKLTISAPYYGVSNHDYYSSTLITPTIRYGLTESVESSFFIVARKLKKIHYSFERGTQSCLSSWDPYDELNDDLNTDIFNYENYPMSVIRHEDMAQNISDLVGILKWKFYESQSDKSYIIASYFGGFAVPGIIEHKPVRVTKGDNTTYVTTPIDYDSAVASIVLGASTLIEHNNWQLLGSFSANLERMNKIGNRAGHLLTSSIAVGKTMIIDPNSTIYGSVEFDWTHTSQQRYLFSRIRGSQTNIIWGGPNITIDYPGMQLKLGIQWPLFFRNTPYFSHRLGFCVEFSL